MSVDVPARERAQMALARLQDPLGYDLWWLARPDAIETQAWHVIFPALAIIELIGADGRCLLAAPVVAPRCCWR